MTVREWARRWPGFARRDRDPETIRRTVSGFREFVSLCGDAQLEEVTPELWALRNPGKVRYVRVLFADAVKAGVARNNPAEHLHAPAARPKEHYLPSEGEVRLIADELGPLRKFALVAAFSGLRVSEVCDLEARDWSVETARLSVRDGKGHRDRTVVLFAPELLREAPQAGRLFLRERVTRTGWLTKRELIPWTGKHVANRWARAREACGLPVNFRFHDLRRFHATWLLDRGASDLDVAVQLGHMDGRGVPNAGLVRRIYGRPSVDAALGRLQALG